MNQTNISHLSKRITRQDLESYSGWGLWDQIVCCSKILSARLQRG